MRREPERPSIPAVGCAPNRLTLGLQRPAEPNGSKAQQLAVRAAWLVETAWSAALAGDIDDVAEHVQLEERATDPDLIR